MTGRRHSILVSSGGNAIKRTAAIVGPFLLVVGACPVLFAQTATSGVVGTGQSACYDASLETPYPAFSQPFYGQDAQYERNLPSYTLSGDRLTVHDNVTGLAWVTSADTDGAAYSSRRQTNCPGGMPWTLPPS
jgi:hypothetical protein